MNTESVTSRVRETFCQSPVPVKLCWLLRYFNREVDVSDATRPIHMFIEHEAPESAFTLTENVTVWFLIREYLNCFFGYVSRQVSAVTVGNVTTPSDMDVLLFVPQLLIVPVPRRKFLPPI